MNRFVTNFRGLWHFSKKSYQFHSTEVFRHWLLLRLHDKIEELSCQMNLVRSLVWVWINWMTGLTDGRLTSGWGSSGERSSFGSWFSTFVFRNVPGTVPECVRICGFKRNSSNLDRAPKMRDSVRLNSWESFLVTLPSIFSETRVIYSSLILGTDVFRDYWPFLRCSCCVSFVTAANFRLFLEVVIFLKGKCYTNMKTELVFICYSTWDYNKKYDSLE